jgi:(2Fe-2S) ferredoxin
MKQDQTPYEKQIFVCTNNAHGEKASCGDQNGEEIFRQLRETAKKNGLHPKIRVAQAKCLGQCGKGCNIMVYPDNVWYSGVTVNDIPAIAEKYLSQSS